MFSPDDIQARLRQQPFIPLRIVTTTGRAYDIPHPELVMVGRHFVIVGLPSKENPTQVEQVTQVALIHVTELQNLPILAPKQNGPPG
jgi:hypothetical protein